MRDATLAAHLSRLRVRERNRLRPAQALMRGATELR
jgi:hypothetical protein